MTVRRLAVLAALTHLVAADPTAGAVLRDTLADDAEFLVHSATARTPFGDPQLAEGTWATFSIEAAGQTDLPLTRLTIGVLAYFEPAPLPPEELVARAQFFLAGWSSRAVADAAPQNPDLFQGEILAIPASAIQYEVRPEPSWGSLNLFNVEIDLTALGIQVSDGNVLTLLTTKEWGCHFTLTIFPCQDCCVFLCGELSSCLVDGAPLVTLIRSAATGSDVVYSSSGAPSEGLQLALRLETEDRFPASGRALRMRDAPGGKASIRARLGGPTVEPGLVDPSSTGATLTILNPVTNESESFSLPAGEGWREIRSRGVAVGHRYRDGVGAQGPCRSLVIRQGKIRVVCRSESGGIGFSLDDPTQGALSARVRMGTTSWCATFDAPAIKKDRGKTATRAGLFHAVDAEPPALCPSFESDSLPLPTSLGAEVPEG